MVRNRINRKDGTIAVGLRMPRIEKVMDFTAAECVNLRDAIRNVGGKTNVCVHYCDTIQKSDIFPRNIVDKKTLEALDSGTTNHTKVKMYELYV